MALTRDLVLQIRAINKASASITAIREQVDALNASVQALNTGAAPPASAGRSWSKLSKAVEIHNETIKNADGSVRKIRNAYDAMGKKIERLSHDFTVHNKVTDVAAQNLDEVGKKAGIASNFFRGLTNSTRVSAEGFGKMIANNVTWLAGFAVIGATIGTVTKLFAELVDRQNEFVKSSRLIATAFSDQRDRAIANTLAYQDMTRQMARTGRSAAEVVEAQYQLSSAGLSLKEVLGGLGPALDLIDAAQDDITQTTKLLAGIMNNFGDTMYRTAEGNIVFANSTRAVSEGLQDNVTEFEKMKKVSDLLATAFDKHQAELNELRDGLKFSIPAAKAAGVGLDELTAALITLEDHMLKGGRAGRSLRVMMSTIVKEPEKMKAAFKTAFDPKEIDPMISFLKRAAIEFNNITDQAERTALAYDIFTTRGGDAFLVFAQNVEEPTENLEELRIKAEDVARVMAEVARSSPERQFKRLWYSIVNLVDALGGGGLVSTLAKLSGVLATFFQILADGANTAQRLAMAIREYTLETAKDAEGWRGALARLFSQKFPIPEQDPLFEALFGENYEEGWKVINKWADGVLVVNDALEEKDKKIADNKKEMDDYVANIEKAYEKNKLLADSIGAVSGVLASLKIGQDVSQGLISAGEGARRLGINLENIAQQSQLDTLNAHVNTFQIYIDKAKVTMEQFGKFTSEAITPAVQGFQQAQSAVAQYTQELIDANYKTDQLKATISTLGADNASQLMQLGEALGLGASSAGQFLDQVNQLEPEISKLRDEYAEAVVAGAEQEKLVGIYDKLDAAQEKQSKALEKANNALAISIPLLQQRAASTESAIALNQRLAENQNKIARSEKETADQREQAAQREEKYIQDSIKLLENQAKDRVKLSELAFKQNEKGEYEHQQDVLQIYQETSDKIRGLQEQLGESHDRRLKLQGQKEEETKKKLEESQRVLKDYNKILVEIGKIIRDIDLPKLAEGLKKPFEDSKKHLKDVNEQMVKFLDKLEEAIIKAEELAAATKKVEVAGGGSSRIPANAEELRFGGLTGASPLAKVTAGEGFVPPGIAKRHLSALQAINQGNAVPANFPIHRFSGPPGIDNILTSMPAGSFVISKRGMDAIDRAMDYDRSRRHYQTGGVVTGGATAVNEPMTNNESTSKFELTLVVGGQSKTYPLTGSTSVVDELRRTLERENLTRLG